MDHTYRIELTEGDPMAAQPEAIRIPLKPHQKAALQKAMLMERDGAVNYFVHHTDTVVDTHPRYSPLRGRVKAATNVGVIGDIVGYGKTLTALSIIAATPPNQIYRETKHTLSVSGRNIAQFTATYDRPVMTQPDRFINTTLVVVPRGPVYVQWEDTIRNNTSLKILALDSLPHIRKQCPGPGTRFEQLKEFFERYDVILVSNTSIKTFLSYYDIPYQENPIVAFNRIMIDEAHVLLHKMQLFDFRFLWLITGTYQVLPTCVYGSRSTMPFVLREMLIEDRLPYMLLKGNRDFVMRSFEVPPAVEHYYLCEMPRSLSIVQPFLPPHILDRINANDVAGAIRELGGTSETESDLVTLVTRDIQRDINNKTREIQYVESLELAEDAREHRLQNLRTDLTRLEDRLASLTDRITQLSEKTCAICYDNFTNPIMLPCTHVFCGGCIMQWLNSRPRTDATQRVCPQCRVPITCQRLIAIVEQGSPSAIASAPASNSKTPQPRPMDPPIVQSKEDTLMRILQEQPDGKFLVFSRFDGGIFWRIIPKLQAAGIPYAEIKGTTYQMVNILDRFKRGEIRVILLNTHYAGSGIDISCATDVVILHAMEHDKTQAVGRAQRVGRTVPLRVHNLCYTHEMSQN